MNQTGKENEGEMPQSGFLQLVRPNEGLLLLLLGSISSFELAEELHCIEHRYSLELPPTCLWTGVL